MSQEVDLIALPKQSKTKFVFWLELNLRVAADRSQQLVSISFPKNIHKSFSHNLYWIAAGPLCLGKHADTKDRRLDDNYPTFKKFNRTLHWTCEAGDPAILEITPNTSWPDIVYYNSFTHANMGWKIHIVDSYRKNSMAFATVPSTLVWAPLAIIGCVFTLFV